MDKRDDNYDPVVEGLVALGKEATSFSPARERIEARDSLWMRWLKYFSLIFVPAVVFGLGFMLTDYVRQHQAETYYQRESARDSVRNDTVSSMRWRFIIGASIGGGLGLIYVTRCIVRRVDP